MFKEAVLIKCWQEIADYKKLRKVTVLLPGSNETALGIDPWILVRDPAFFIY